MSSQITTAFVQQYSANVQMLSQQMGSRLRDAVRVESIVGKNAFMDQIGVATAQLRTSRHADTPQLDTPHARRRLSLADYEYADLIDDPIVSLDTDKQKKSEKMFEQLSSIWEILSVPKYLNDWDISIL